MGIQKKYSKMKYNFLVVTVFSSPVFYPKTDYVELKDEKSFIPGKLTQQIFFEPGLLALNDQLEASGHFALDEFNEMENDAMNSVTQPDGDMEIQADEIEAFTESTTYEVTSTTDELYSPIETTATEIISSTDKLYTTPITTTAESTSTTTQETSTRLITIQSNDPGMTTEEICAGCSLITTEASFFDKVRDFFAQAGAWIQSWFKINF